MGHRRPRLAPAAPVAGADGRSHSLTSTRVTVRGLGVSGRPSLFFWVLGFLGFLRCLGFLGFERQERQEPQVHFYAWQPSGVSSTSIAAITACGLIACCSGICAPKKALRATGFRNGSMPATC